MPLPLTLALAVTFQDFLLPTRCWRTTFWPAAFGVTRPRILTVSSLTMAISVLAFAVTLYFAGAAWAAGAVRASEPAVSATVAASAVMRFMGFPVVCSGGQEGLFTRETTAALRKLRRRPEEFRRGRELSGSRRRD